MKLKIKITFLLLTCFTLMGCPAGHFYDYKYLGNELPNEEPNFHTSIELNEQTNLFVRIGDYHEFIYGKKSGLVAIIKVNPTFDLSKDSLVKEVKSSFFGKLTKTDSLPYTARKYILDTTNTIMYNLTFDTVKTKEIVNDTISIELTNGKKLQFVRNELGY